MKYNIYTFSFEEERKSGVLTNAIFSFCLCIGALLCIIINWGITSFIISRKQITETYQFSQIYFLEYWLPILYVIIMSLFILYMIFFLYYGTQAVLQLMTGYAGIENGSIIKMRWKSYRTPYTYESIIAAGLLTDLIPGRRFSDNNRFMARGFSIIKGISRMQNPKFIYELLNRESSHPNVECSLLKNIELVKKKKKYIIIRADVVYGDKLRRKKLLIYNMYKDMDDFIQICKGGGTYVNQ